MKVVGVIASRYGSSRLPGKAVKDICGKPMVWWVYERVKKSKKLNEILVATDDERIVEICDQYNIPSILTSSSHREAANRVHEVSQSISADFYIQINGDEPLIDSSLIDMAIPEKIPMNIEFGTNIVTKMKDPVEVMDASNIKVVFDEKMMASYMSRTPIPYPYRNLTYSYFKHIGIIGYNKKMLDFYANNGPGRFEIIEGIATLRFTDYGKQLLCIEADNVNSLSVDTEMDLQRVRTIIKNKIKKGEIIL